MAYNKFNNKVNQGSVKESVENKESKNNKKYNGPKMMNRKQVEEAVCWILRKEDNLDFNKKMRLVLYELRGKANYNLIKDVVDKYKM